MKKALILSILALSSTVASAKSENQFERLKDLYKHSHSIRFAIHMDRCENLSDKEHFLKNIAVFTPNEIILQDDSFSASLDHFTKDNPLFPATPVLEHVKFIFQQDGFLYLNTELLNPRDYSPMSDVYQIRCRLDGKAVQWAASF